MKVILLSDVDCLGHEGDVVEVRDGYARNYLLPRGLAVRATVGALRDLELRRDSIERRNQQKRAVALAMAELIGDQPLIIRHMVGDRGRLHGRVTTAQIAQAMQEQFHVSVDRRDIQLREPIRSVGDYVISARLFDDVVVDLTIRIAPLTAEGEEHVLAGPTSPAQNSEGTIPPSKIQGSQQATATEDDAAERSPHADKRTRHEQAKQHEETGDAEEDEAASENDEDDEDVGENDEEQENGEEDEDRDNDGEE
jgi:large subunit ribosomal protein L9